MNTQQASTGSDNSAFYIGTVFHKRFVPKAHQFKYPLYMLYLDLDEIAALDRKHWWFSANRWAPLQFNASDYFSGHLPTPQKNPATQTQTQKGKAEDDSMEKLGAAPLKQLAIHTARELGADVSQINRVCMLAQVRCFGFYFSPVNFFFLYEANHAKYLVAEVSNTPWNKKHCYLVNLEDPEPIQKSLHVSPFMTLDMTYHWDVLAPAYNTLIRIENRDTDALSTRLFTAVFSAKRYEISPQSVRKVLLRWPAVTAIIIKNIYWQACKLFLKGIKYIPYQTEKNSQH